MLFKLSKKGMEAGFLVVLIITIASFILIAGVVMRFMSSADDKEAEILCHDSVLMRAQSVVNIDTTLADAEIKIVPTMCKTIDKKIKGDREELKRQIADKMARCWWMFGEGKYEEILAGSNVDVLPSVFGTENQENQCFNCYNLMIDEDKIEGGSITGTEMNEFMYNEKYSRTNATYMEYIQSYGGPGRVVFTAADISPREAYALSFLPKNKEYDEKSFWSGVGKVVIGGAVVIGVAAGAVCIVSTAGICTAVVGPLAAVATGTTGIGLTILAAPTTVAVGTAAAAVIATTGYWDIMDGMYAEREVSSVYVGYLAVGEKMCGSGDIAGE
ncbi:hypothetical protein HZC30_00515 [Candidatus Woesearchaeota archaeon]|nr:hypothetical protein [Candidatus Woesearchaeota archaeon]